MNDRDYIFISYKGEDAEVLSFIHRLEDAGFRLWYDVRLLAADEWAEVVEKHIRNSGYFLTLVTEDFLRSPWCEKEVLTARSGGVPVLVVFLCDARLPRQLRSAFQNVPVLERNDYADEEMFFEALCAVDGLADFCAPPVLPAPIRISLEVKPLGTSKWHSQIKARPGDTARWRVHGEHVGDLMRENFSVRCILPTGLQLVPGTTTIFNNVHPEGVTLSDRITENSGVNLGTYAPSSDFWLYFNTEVVQAPEYNVIFRSIIQASYGRDSGTVEASADVIVDAEGA